VGRRLRMERGTLLRASQPILPAHRSIVSAPRSILPAQWSARAVTPSMGAAGATGSQTSWSSLTRPSWHLLNDTGRW